MSFIQAIFPSSSSRTASASAVSANTVSVSGGAENRSKIKQPRLPARSGGAAFLLCCGIALFAGCEAPGRPSSDTAAANENRNLHGVVDEQQARIDQLTADKVGLARRVKELEAKVHRVDSTERVVEKAKAEISDSVKRVLSQFRGDAEIEVEKTDGGYRFVLREAVLFTTGSATVSKEGAVALQRVANALRGGRSRVTIAGHTDDVRVAKPATLKKFPRGNIELSTARALGVWDHLVKSAGIPASRLSVAGFGPHQPRVPNSSDSNRWRNRRVEILVED